MTIQSPDYFKLDGVSSEKYVCISPRSAINQDVICSFKTGIGEITYKAISLHKEENK